MPDTHAVTPRPPWSPGQTPQPEAAVSLSPGVESCLEARTLHAAPGGAAEAGPAGSSLTSRASQTSPDSDFGESGLPWEHVLSVEF